MQSLADQYQQQQFANGYELVDGVAMHAENGDRFQIPPAVLKRHVRPGQFVELRLDSPRFSVHQQDAHKCTCPSCHGDLIKPILRHEQPATLLPLPEQQVPSRGWGEDFWVQVSQHSGPLLRGRIDNPLVESRLHGLNQNDEILFHEHHILAVHPRHRQELVAAMNAADLKELVVWLGRNPGQA